MANVKTTELFPKNKFTQVEVEAERQQRLTLSGVLGCDITEDDTNYILTTTFPDPNENDGGAAAAGSAAMAAAVMPATNGGSAAATPAGAGSFPTPRDGIELCIKTWEGLFQDSPADRGNFAHCRDGSTKLVGTMRGVTPDAFAQFQGIDPCSVTADILKASVTLKMAVDIAMHDYYAKYHFDQLLWCPIVDIAFDIAFGSGPGQSITMLQQLIGAGVDGGIGPQTIEALDLFVEAHDIEDACNQFADMRIEFYKSISEPGTKNAQFRQGWINRANWARPSDVDWWKRWKGWTMPHPAGSSKPTGVVPQA
jgi:lysozyme family protein